MKIRVKRFDTALPLPEYKTAGAAAMDCYIREELTIPPGEIRYALLNVALQPPRGHFVLLAARSSLHKRGLMLPHGIGIGDEDFSGDEDEYKAPLFNYTKEPVTVAKGDRLVQLLVLPFDRVEWDEVSVLGNESRGGFGSTGNS
jgi:dUTP pyrophosphatase